jgi:hypothetical protein
MEQRRLRLGDTLDDYCPRERRVTNHAVVAMIEEDVKQTRCTTCDTEHPYKGARVPRRRKKETPSALFKEVLAGMPDTDAHGLTVADAATQAGPEPEALEPAGEPVTAGQEAEALHEDRAPVPSAPVMNAGGDEPEPEPQPERPEDWPVHRPLIRATLPRIEGQKEERRPTEFTIRQPGGRGPTSFRGGPKHRGQGGGSGDGNGNGNRSHGGSRFAGGRPSGPGRGPAGRGGPSAGFRGGPPRHGGGKKRSR